MTTPVSVRSATFEDVHEAARASTAWTAMYLGTWISDHGHHFAEMVRAQQQQIDESNHSQALHVERLKHDLGSVLAVFRGVERWLSLRRM
jgi:hypothetical protein